MSEDLLFSAHLVKLKSQKRASAGHRSRGHRIGITPTMFTSRYDNGGYYMYDVVHPGIRISVNIL